MKAFGTFPVAAFCCLSILYNSGPSIAFVSSGKAPPRQGSFAKQPCQGNSLPGIRYRSNESPFHRRRRRSNRFVSVKPEKHENLSCSSTKQTPDGAPNYYNKAIVSAWLAFSILFFPLQAQAGFGPSGGATTSPTPGVLDVELQNLSQKKLQQLIDNTMDERRLNEFQSQLDAIIDGIASTLNQGTTEEETSAEEVQQETSKATQAIKNALPNFRGGGEQGLKNARSFQTQILNRERLLEKLEAQPWWFNYFAAFCGSVASTLVVHPVDTIKTRLQVVKSNATDEDNSMFTNLYEGLAANILKEGPPSALYLGVYESVKSSLLRGKLATLWASLLGAASASTGAAQVAITADPTYLLSIYLAAGAAGEIVGSTIRAPAEAIKSMVQTQAASSTSEALDMVLVRPEGRSNVMRAWSASALRDVPFGAIQLALFELIKAYILNNPNIDFDSSTLQSEAIIGAFAGGVGSFLTNPLDVITTRIITQSTKVGGEEPLGIVEMGKRIYGEGGLRAFFAGWEARVLYWAPAISLFLTCYCSVRQLGVKLELFG